MTSTAPRSLSERMVDTLAKLTAVHADVWVSTASAGPDGDACPYLVPLSFAWIDERIVLALDDDSRTARGLVAAGVARLGLGHTRDVVMIDAGLRQVHPVAEVPRELADAYAAQADWDPRVAGPKICYLVLEPHRIQAWREANELAGRTLMTDGAWTD